MDRERDKEREKNKERDRDREREKNKEKDRDKERSRDRERGSDKEKERESDREQYKEKKQVKSGLQNRLLAALYGTAPGRLLLRVMITPGFSKLGGRLLESRLSALAIRPFVHANKIDLSDCKKKRFRSFNDFFQRELREGARPQDCRAESFISPCDARLQVYPVTKEGRFCVKNTRYTVEELLRDGRLAERFAGGTLWILRLGVEDYHRYIYPVTGLKSQNRNIQGVFHTVNPIANESCPIYKENTREYCLLKTQDAGCVLMMEVGAMLVGRIENRQRGRAQVVRGEEKGAFAFGGSTIILMTQKGRVRPDVVYTENTKRGEETKVRQGSRIGVICPVIENVAQNNTKQEEC